MQTTWVDIGDVEPSEAQRQDKRQEPSAAPLHNWVDGADMKPKATQWLGENQRLVTRYPASAEHAERHATASQNC
jgi:hypothetical protein